MTEHVQDQLHGPLLVTDSHPWYRAPAQYDRAVERAFSGLGFHVMGADELAERCDLLVRQVLRKGDLVVLPLMSGALFTGTVRRRADPLGVPVLCLPLSRHPFVTLSADPPETLLAACASYARSSELMAEEFTGRENTARPRRRGWCSRGRACGRCPMSASGTPIRTRSPPGSRSSPWAPGSRCTPTTSRRPVV